MDLDNIKKTWQATDLKSTVGEDKIKKMLDNKGRGAFANLLKFEKLFFLLLIPCLFFAIALFFMHLFPAIVYSALLIPAFVWQNYKIRYLKGIDFSAMGILEVSKKMTRYKKFLFYEIVVGVVWAILFLVSYTYYGLPKIFPRLFVEGGSNLYTIIFVSTVLLTFLSLTVIYKYIYFNNIKKIQEAVKEVEEFEEDNK